MATARSGSRSPPRGSQPPRNARQPGQAPPQQTLPLYDVFLDVPHPAAASACPPVVILRAPSGNEEMEKELSANLSRIARFAFPEFDDGAQKIPRETALNRYSQYAMQPRTFQQYTFSLQLQSGVRLHGHVRRYLPVHQIAKTRYDVGRRGERALVILTRVSGGDLVYSAILKTVDAISFLQSAAEKTKKPNSESRKAFLHKLFHEHQRLCRNFATIPIQERKPMVLTVDGFEVGNSPVPLLSQVDTSRFLIPTSLLTSVPSAVESVASSPILPLLRVLGVSNTLRLLSALLSESRILLISSSPTRLAQCARSALSILAQGLLNWQHLYIPVLPPHLFQYLAAPVPYLIGILKSLAPRLDQAPADGLGEMFIINLDHNAMETRGINPNDVLQRIPDLFRTAMAEQNGPSASMSASEMLAQDLVDLLKVDKRTLYGESTLTNVSETAAKATKAVKSGFLKLKEKGKQFLQNRAGSSVSDSGSGGEDDQAASTANSGTEVPAIEGNLLLPDFIYTQGSQNETAEEEARIAFTSFFLSMFGNMRWYLSANPGKLPQLDRQRFLQQKTAMGEGEQTSIWPLLQNFCQTQMLEEFAKARVEEVRTRQPVTAVSALFSQCANYHRLHSIDFSVVNVRRVARQVAQSNPSRPLLQTSARRMAMLLTSNKTFEGDYNKAVAQLVEQCRECSSVLFDVMSVIWVRMRDSKGIHWKHGYQSLQILRNLLYHGPLAAIAEATDGLDKIRLMKFYNDNMRSQICTQIRSAATQVYNLLVDRAKLFSIRRLCINKRRTLRKPDQGRLEKNRMIKIFQPFKANHNALHPNARTQVAPAPSGLFSAPAAPRTSASSGEQDLLGFGTASSAAAPPNPTSNADPFGLSSAFTIPSSKQPTSPQDTDAATKDMLGLFENVAVSSAVPPSSAQDPFATGTTAQQVTQSSNAHPAPTQGKPRTPPRQGQQGGRDQGSSPRQHHNTSVPPYQKVPPGPISNSGDMNPLSYPNQPYSQGQQPPASSHHQPSAGAPHYRPNAPAHQTHQHPVAHGTHGQPNQSAPYNQPPVSQAQHTNYFANQHGNQRAMPPQQQQQQYFQGQQYQQNPSQGQAQYPASNMQQAQQTQARKPANNVAQFDPFSNPF